MVATITESRLSCLKTTAVEAVLPSVQLREEEKKDEGIEKLDIPLPPVSKLPTKILDVDKKTPDNHVPRDPRLIRLTGAHPFNVEPPLTTLFNQGFITPVELFFVRNHGYVPQVHDADIPDWELSIEGLVENPITLNFKQILSEFEQLTYPVTLTCAGNRRKEQNVVRKSNGFAWGSAGTSTALFTGPSMASVIRRAKPLRKAKFLCMEGADQLPNGNYGTSIKLNWAMDPNKGVMLAHRMNGMPLQPDHGRPLRAVVPGQIGGRSVKWIKRLILTESPSSNWYHINDNRVLPTMVSPSQAAQEPHWWKDDRYAIYDVNVNSSVVYPQHGEEVEIDTTPSYTVKGYAYGGGGRRINRVEVSLDDGASWRLSNIEYPEDRYREVDTSLFGGQIDMWWRETCFCWCFWSLEVPMADLQSVKAVTVRAMDESLNIQPRDMYWSVLGMMNNPWFRVTVTKDHGRLKFEHPTQPVVTSLGWMERVKAAGGNLTNAHWGETTGTSSTIQVPPPPEPPKIEMKNPSMTRLISIDELKAHESDSEPWFVLDGAVYDGAPYMKEHPGGAASITATAGMDVTAEFMAIHSEKAKAMMKDFQVGILDAPKNALEDTGQDSTLTSREIFLNPRSWSRATLCKKTSVSPDSAVFTFALGHASQAFGLPTGQHVLLQTADPSDNGNPIIRAYTPISESTARGTVDILIKIYRSTPDHPGGKMTLALDALPIGSSIGMKGPYGKFQYLHNGHCLINGNERVIRRFYMICGGSGITPIFQVLRAILQESNAESPSGSGTDASTNPGTKPDSPSSSCLLLYGNRTVADILCHAELDTFASRHRDRCTIVHALTQPPRPEGKAWKWRTGRISRQLVEEFARPPPGDKGQSLVLVCGPKPMEEVVHTNLLEFGWNESDEVFF